MIQLSIITVNLNNSKGLIRTLNSIKCQSVYDFELILIDGASSDESISIITSFEFSKPQYFMWLSEPDNGIYNAMNKGIEMANGKYLLFINSGDELADEYVVSNFLNNVNEFSEICSGNLLLIDDDVTKLHVSPLEISLYYCIHAGLTHPNTFIQKSLFDRYGFYNETNKIISDWEFFLIATGLNNCIYQKLYFNVAKFYQDGLSSQNQGILNSETNQAIKRLIPKPILKDIHRLQNLENLIIHPAFKLCEQSSFFRKAIAIIYKVYKKFYK